MNAYEPSTPRTALGLIAVAMAAITMGALVVLPAEFDSASADRYTLAAAKAVTTAPAISPARPDVPETGNREEHVHFGRTTLGAQELRGKPHKSSSRSRTNT